MTLPYELERLMNELAKKIYQDTEADGALRKGFLACFQALSESAGEFDEQAALEGSGKHHDGTRRKFAEGARFQFEQDRALISVHRQATAALIHKYGALEARLAESERAHKAEVAQLEAVCANVGHKLSAADARVEELEKTQMKVIPMGKRK